MTADLLIAAAVGLLPVLCFLAVLERMDAHRLVSVRTVLTMIAAGAMIAAACYFINGFALDALNMDRRSYSYYISPIIEESLKAGVLIFLFARNRIGFMVDAAIIGFAVGAGFSLVENVFYLHTLAQANVGVWIVRGFGTAIMHGGATAVFGVLSQSLTERHLHFHPQLYLPGLVLAIALHSFFNHFPGSPFLAMIATLVVFPITLLFVFSKSEHAIHNWLLADFRSHEDLLLAVRSGEFTHSEAGRFISDLARTFDAAHVEAMFDYIRLHTELVLRAERLLLAREGGSDQRLHQADREDFGKLHALERRIGRVGLLAIWPHLHFSRQELWELYELEHEAFHVHEGVRAHAHHGVRAYARRLRQRARQTLMGSRKLTLTLHKWLRLRMRRAT